MKSLSVITRQRMVARAHEQLLYNPRIWIIAALSVLYVGAFFAVYPTGGAASTSISVIPVILVGWWFGTTTVIYIAAVFAAANTLLIAAAGQVSFYDAMQQNLLGTFALFVVGVVMGRMHDLDARFQQELAERKRAENALKQQQAALEQQVAERTRELRTANDQLQQEIAERAQTQADLQSALEREKELNQLKSRFSSMVSHEFRTPLAVIRSTADILLKYSNELTDDSRVNKLQRIQSQVDHMVSLLDDVLTISRAEVIGHEFEPVVVDLRDYCHTVTSEFQLTGGTHQVQFSAELQEVPARIDKRLLRQALTNLVSNAIKYSPKGSTVVVGLRREGDQAHIFVRDQGIGIPDEDQQNLFVVFHRANNVGVIPGFGLGLTIAKHAVEAHGGTITVQSRVNYGTEFTITLPITSSASTPASAAS